MSRPAWTAVLLAGILWTGCGDPSRRLPVPPADPATAALELFAAGRVLVADGDDLPEGLLETTRLERDPVGALEVLASLAEMSSPEIESLVPLPGLDRVAVEVVAALPGGGVANVSVQVEPVPDGTWRVVAIAAPGRDWPSRARRGNGLSVSAPVGELR